MCAPRPAALRRASELLGARDEFRGRNPERRGELEDACEARVQLTALDAADVVSMEPARLAEPLLRETALSPELAHCRAEGDVLGREGCHD